MRTKSFDCVEMKRQGAAQVYERTKGMSLEEELAYWQERTREMRKRLAVGKQRKAA